MHVPKAIARLVCLLFLATAAWSQTTTADGLVYTINGASVTITGYTGTGTAVTIPASIGGVPVTRIANSAFKQKTTLTGITFPSSITTIEAYAFDGCSNLTNLTLPSGLQVLEGFSFAFCSALTSVTIPASVITIGRGPFTGCLALTDLTVAAGNANYASTTDGAFILSKDGLNLVQCAPGRSGSITVPATVTHLTSNAFDNCQKLTAISLPSGLKTIGAGVFSACLRLTALALPEGLTSIGEGAFINCVALATINLPSTLTFLDGAAFQYCYSIRSIVIPSGVTEINPWTFYLSGLTNITLPSTLTRIGGHAFRTCNNLKSITIPASVTTMGDAVFGDCANLTTVAFLGNAPTIGAPLFPATGVTSVYYAGGKSGWTSTFSGLPTTVLAAPAISLPPVRQVAAVGQAVTFTVAATGSPAPAYQWRREGTAISGATNATLSLPNVTSANAGGYDVVVTNVAGSVTSTGVPLVVGQAVTDGFVYNEAAAQLAIVGYQGTATSLTIPATLGGKPVTQIGFDAFKANSLLTSVVISEGITTLLQGAFFECPNLTSVVVPSTVSAIGSYAFLGCPKLTTITVAAANPFFSSEAGVLYNQAKTILYQCSGALSGRLVLPSTVTTISANAFWGCSFTSISFPATLTTLAPGAFYGMSSAFTAAYFRGAAPALSAPGPFDGFPAATIYYDSRAPGWGATYGTRPTAAYDFPSITTHPVTQSVAPGGNVTFSVAATGNAPLSYQWTRHGTAVAGATGTTLSITNAQLAQAGRYQVTVTNAAGSAVSAPAELRLTGQLWGMGDDAFSRFGFGAALPPRPPQPVAAAIAGVEAAGDRTFFLGTDGTVWAAGANGTGGLGDGTTTNRPLAVPVATGVARVIAGDYHTLFLKTDGSLWAVGQNGSGQLGDGTYTNRSTSVQVATEVVDAAAGGYQSLYLKADGTAWAMGLNNYGQLGDGSLASRALPVQIASGVSQVAAGYSFSFYIKTDGTLWAMGQNHRGQLGDGTTTNRSVPVQVAIGVASVAAGARHTLFVKTDGSLWGMGYNFFGQLGDSSNTTRLSPVPVATGVASVVAGYYHTLYCKVDGTLWAMGSNFYGILGDGGTLSRNSPVQVASGVTAAAAGIEHSIFLRSDGSAWGMGRNEYGQIGNGTTSARSSPAQIGAGLSTAAAGAYHAVFLKSDGTLWSAGYNGSGRLGDGSYTNRSSLVQVASGVVHLAAGREHSAFLKGDGTLWTVGRNGDGQLGDGTTVDRPTPLQVASDVASVATGDHHTLFVKSDGSLWATGRNSEGRLGDGTTVSRSTPVQVAAGVAAVAGGADHTLFLRNDGTAWSVGSNLRGQLGDGTTTNRASPVQIATGVARIAAGSEHSLLLRSDGSLAGFGYNVYGQLGDGTTTNRLGPITIATGVIDLAGGSYHSLFLKTDGSVWAMGNNSDGALGQLPRIAVKVPTQIASGVVGLSAGGEASFFLLREGAGTAPAITAQPVALSAAFGARVTLSVTASGSSPLDYVWRRNGVELPDFRTATLALPYLQIADAGSYSVTVRNSAGSVTSAEAPVAYTGTTPEGFAYATTGSSMTITDYTGPGGAVSVPATILGQPVIEIGPGVFSGRGDLTAVTLPAGLLRIAANAFRHCTGLTTVTLPASLTTLEGFAFLGCTGLSEIRVTTGNATFSSVDGVLFRGTELLRYPPAKAGTTYAVPAGTTSLAANSFQAAPLSAVSFPVSLTHLEGYPFFQCAQLTALHLPATLTTILHNPAEGSGVLNITVAAENPNYAARDGLLVNKAGTVLLGYPSGRTLATFTVPSGITEIGSRAFRNASAALTTLYLPATLARLSGSAGESGISNAPGLRDLVFLGAPPVVAADYFSGLAASAQALYLPASGAWPATLGGLPTVPMVAPAIVTPPQPQTVPVPGGTVTLSVAASSSPAPSYQWYLNGQLLPGATRATLTLDNVQSAAAGNYRVVVTNPAGSTSSGNAAFQIVQPGNTATQAVAGPGYAAGQPLTIVNQLTYEGTASALSWAVLLPPGWTFASSTAADTSAAPVPGQTDLLEWAWSSIPPSTVEFRYTVNVPAGQTGPRELVALAGVRNGASLQFLAQPDPLVVTEVATHSADVDRNYRISLLELTRVIELYNTRNGTSRTGAYAVAAAVTEDGFEPAPTRLASAVVTLVRYHSGDSNRDGKLGLLELTRVIELYNYRSGTSRTGQYKVKSGTEDGFDPGP